MSIGAKRFKTMNRTFSWAVFNVIIHDIISCDILLRIYKRRKKQKILLLNIEKYLSKSYISNIINNRKKSAVTSPANVYY